MTWKCVLEPTGAAERREGIQRSSNEWKVTWPHLKKESPRARQQEAERSGRCIFDEAEKESPSPESWCEFVFIYHQTPSIMGSISFIHSLTVTKNSSAWVKHMKRFLPFLSLFQTVVVTLVWASEEVDTFNFLQQCSQGLAVSCLRTSS